MNAKLKRIVVILAVPVSLSALLGAIGLHYFRDSIASQEARHVDTKPAISLAAVNVSLPPGQSTFPPGPGADIANSNCVICHSTGMVLRQPPLTTNEWKIEIEKMRNAFGAPIPADQIDTLARYLNTVNGRKPQANSSGRRSSQLIGVTARHGHADSGARL